MIRMILSSRRKNTGFALFTFKRCSDTLEVGKDTQTDFFQVRHNSDILLGLKISGIRREINMDEKTNGGVGFLNGFLFGATLGGLAGLLFAPKAGRELRADLRQKSREVADKAGEISSEAQVRAREILEDARRRAEELKKEAERQLTEARQKAREALRIAEEKASEVRKLARETVEEARKEAKRLRAAVEAGVEAAKQELSKEEDKPRTTA